MFGNFSGEGKCLETGQRKKSCSTSSKAWLPWPSKRNRSWTIVFIWACVSWLPRSRLANITLSWSGMLCPPPSCRAHSPCSDHERTWIECCSSALPNSMHSEVASVVWMDSVILTCVYDMFPQAPETLHSSLSGLHQWDCWFAAEWGWSWNRSFSNVYRRL